MQKWAYVIVEEFLFISRGQLMFEKQPRLCSIWQLLANSLIKGPIKLPDIMAIAGSDFREMSPLLALLAESKPD